MARHEVMAEVWRTSSASGAGECVEVRFASDRVEVRDTKDRNGPILAFTHAEWRAFLKGVHGGEFELPAVACRP